jgi:plastocyanin
MKKLNTFALAIVLLLTQSAYYGGGYVEPPTGSTGGSSKPAATTTLNAVVGPGATITLKKGTTKVTKIKKGSYKIVVDDKSSFHNFHLTGPSVNKTTTVGQVAKVTWTLTLKVGKFNFVCDPHSGSMRGSFTVTN